MNGKKGGKKTRSGTLSGSGGFSSCATTNRQKVNPALPGRGRLGDAARAVTADGARYGCIGSWSIPRNKALRPQRNPSSWWYCSERFWRPGNFKRSMGPIMESESERRECRLRWAIREKAFMPIGLWTDIVRVMGKELECTFNEDVG